MVSLGPAPNSFATEGGTLVHDGERAVYVSDGWPVWVCRGATWIPPGGLTAEDLDWVAGHLLLAGARRRAARPVLVSSIRLDALPSTFDTTAPTIAELRPGRPPADTSWIRTERVRW